MKMSKVATNTFMLYIMSIAKLIFPLLTLPYLTRVLSEDMYGYVSYVKSCMTYIQLFIDFGFILSAVKDIVNANGDKDKIGHIVGDTVIAKLLLAAVSGVAVYGMWLFIDILQMNNLFLILSFIGVATTAFLADFLFRGIEKMHYITYIYLVAKAISIVLTFALVKSDGEVLWIPVLDVLVNVLSAVISLVIIGKLKIKIRISGLRVCLGMIGKSFTYFLSNVATTAFTALNTILIGIYITDLTEVAHWSLCLSIICAIQGLYSPICNGIYPHMIKERSLRFIHKVMGIFMPIVVMGCLLSFCLAKTALLIVGGEKYVEASFLFRCLIPVLLFSFPAQVYGWPTLGAIGKVKEATATTIIAAVAQVIGLVVLIKCNMFTTVALAVLRGGTEALMMFMRMFMTYKNKALFSR